MRITFAIAMALGCSASARGPAPTSSVRRVAAPVVAAESPRPTCDDRTSHWLLDGVSVLAEPGRLWTGDCEHARLLVAAPDARFDRPIAASAGAMLYSRADGVWQVALATGESRRVYATPRAFDPDCRALPLPLADPGPAGQLRDQLDAVDDDGATLVLVRRGYACHGPSAWTVRVSQWSDPAHVREHVTRPIYSVDADGNDVYFVDGGGVWVTTNGAPPRAIATPGFSPRQVVARHGELAVVSAERTEVGTIRSDGIAFRRIRGEWRPIVLPDGRETVAWLRAGKTIDDLELGTGLQPDGRALQLDPATARATTREFTLHTRDGGKTWHRGVGTREGLGRSVATSDGVYEATEDGLDVVRGTSRSRITDELSAPLPGDRF